MLGCFAKATLNRFLNFSDVIYYSIDVKLSLDIKKAKIVFKLAVKHFLARKTQALLHAFLIEDTENRPTSINVFQHELSRKLCGTSTLSRLTYGLTHMFRKTFDGQTDMKTSLDSDKKLFYVQQ